MMSTAFSLELSLEDVLVVAFSFSSRHTTVVVLLAMFCTAISPMPFNSYMPKHDCHGDFAVESLCRV